jgi:outer membrane protein OmpA-like peptidoglycan-associated protein
MVFKGSYRENIFHNYKNNSRCGFGFVFVMMMVLNINIKAQSFELVKIIGISTGNETNNTLFKASSPTISSLAYIRAQRIEGPQDGIFTQKGDKIRYISKSKELGIPGNLSRIRFTFLEKDKKTNIPLSDFRVIINDIDGPNNESLAVKCNKNLRRIATGIETNLLIDNTPPDLNIIGSVDEKDGPTSRVLFEFDKVSVIEFDNYANYGYLKDFDLNYSSYQISRPFFVQCSDEAKRSIKNIGVSKNNYVLKNTIDFKQEGNRILININPIYFDTDKAEIRNDAVVELKKVAEIMNKYPDLQISLDSHTDSKQEDNYNLRLSEFRALSTKSWIISRGILPSRISEKGFGESQLVNKCSNEVECSEEEHQQNRRTEFVIKNPEVIK